MLHSSHETIAGSLYVNLHLTKECIFKAFLNFMGIFLRGLLTWKDGANMQVCLYGLFVCQLLKVCDKIVLISIERQFEKEVIVSFIIWLSLNCHFPILVLYFIEAHKNISTKKKWCLGCVLSALPVPTKNIVQSIWLFLLYSWATGEKQKIQYI